MRCARRARRAQGSGFRVRGNSRAARTANSTGLSEAGYSKAGKPTARRRYNGGLQRAWLLTVAAGGDRGDFFPDTGTAARRRRGQGSGFGGTAEQPAAPASARPATEDGYRLKVAGCRRTAGSPPGGNPGLQRAWLLTVAAGGDRGDFFPDTGTAARRRRGQGSGFRVQVKTSSRNSPGLSEAGYSKSRLRAFAAVASLALTSFFLASLAAWREFFPVFLSIVSSLQSIVSSLRRWRRLR